MNDISKNAKELVEKAKAKNLIKSYTVAFKDFPVDKEEKNMELRNQEFKVKVETNIDEETKKAKELVSLLERANELIQSLQPIKVNL